MLKGDLPESKLIGNMIETFTPNGFKIHYPAKLAHIAMHEKKYCMFHSMDESGAGHIIVTQPDRIRFRFGGPIEKVADIYEEAPWREKKLIDSNGVFFYKIAPNLQAIEDYIAKVQQKTE